MVPWRTIPVLRLFVLLSFPLAIAQLSLAKEPVSVLVQPPTVTPTQPPLKPELSIPVLEQAVFEQVNQYRVTKGLPPLQLDPRLSALAREHSEEMAQYQVPFGHIDFQARARRINRVIPSRRVSETVAYIFSHQETAKRVVDGWIKSAQHRPILEGEYSFTGVGVAMGQRQAFYFTQFYVRPR